MLHREGLDKTLFVAMIREGHAELAARREFVNSLNVFPVPDGDTGTNMYLSYASGVDHVSKLPIDATLSQVTAALATGFLMGARGNSGVILSQLFRGFQLAANGLSELGPKALAAALTLGVQTAYKAVSRPVEGTILSVARAAALAAEGAARSRDATVTSVLMAAIAQGEEALAMTPQQLPILRQAGVVDSGGQGLVFIYHGFLRAMTGRATEAPTVQPVPSIDTGAMAHGSGEYGYCTEFLIRTGSGTHDAEAIRETMQRHGDSLLVVAADDVVKVHVHTLHPGSVLEAALGFGSLSGIKIDNMTEQNHALLMTTPRVETAGEPALCGLIAVTVGEGITRAFRDAGVDAIVSGGQTMNPSTEEIVSAVQTVHAQTVYVLPNHSNAVLAAEQACAVLPGRVRVIPTKSLGAGLGAALAFVPTQTPEVNDAAMRAAVERIHAGGVTQSVRSSEIDGHTITEGEYLGLIDGTLTAVDVDRTVVLSTVLRQLCKGAVDICTVFTRTDDLTAEAHACIQDVQADFPSLTFEIQFGGQPVYDYVLACE